MIQELKERIGQQAESIIESGMNLERKGKKVRCPNSMAHSNGDRNPSMSWDNKALQFYCFTCGEKIDIYNYYRESLGKSHEEIMEENGLMEPRKEFDLKPITNDCIKYLETRCITSQTITHFKLKSYKGNIAFPYYSGNDITGVKYRKPKKKVEKPKYLSITGSEFGLFNRQSILEFNELIICEGEIDCMIIHQSGFPNVVSVGTGANALDKLFREQKNFLNSFNSLIIVSDNDEAGKGMDVEFIKEFGVKAKIVDKSLFTCKDINEEYYKYGKSIIREIIDSARVKIEGQRNPNIDIYKGMKAVKGKYIPTGIASIDYAINDLAPKCVTLVTGRSNDGKTTFVNQVMANAVDNGNKVYLVSGEGHYNATMNAFYSCVIGRNSIYYDITKVNKREFKEPKPEVLKALLEWHRDKLIIFNKGDSKLKTMTELLDLISFEAKTQGHNLIVIDNLMSILSVEKASEKLEAQADFLQNCSNLAKNENIHVVIVLHPNKTLQKGQEMDFEQISGTQDLANKADNIIVVRKEHDQEKRLEEGVSGYISLIKNRYFPDIVDVKTHFEKETGLLLEISENNQVLGYDFDWRKYLEGYEHTEIGEQIDIETPWEVKK